MQSIHGSSCTRSTKHFAYLIPRWQRWCVHTTRRDDGQIIDEILVIFRFAYGILIHQSCVLDGRLGIVLRTMLEFIFPFPLLLNGIRFLCGWILISQWSKTILSARLAWCVSGACCNLTLFDMAPGEWRTGCWNYLLLGCTSTLLTCSHLMLGFLGLRGRNCLRSRFTKFAKCIVPTNYSILQLIMYGYATVVIVLI